METKSRYEVIADLEQKKRDLIRQRDSFDTQIIGRKKQIKTLQREIEDEKEDLEQFEKTVEDNKKTIKELIISVDDSLNRLGSLNTSHSQKK